MKAAAKTLADAAMLGLAAPAALLYWLGRAILGPGRAFPGWSQSMALVPGLVGVYLRRAFYRLVLPRCGPGCCISFGTILSHPTAEIGRDVYVGPYCGLGDVTLEDDVLLGSHVSILNGGAQHGIDRLDLPIREQAGAFPRVTIGRDSWIGDRSVVLVDVGRHCVVGAGSVVTRPLPDYAVAVGVPARVIRFRGGEGVERARQPDGVPAGLDAPARADFT
jgi:acetyltransferase-like isoleucine patch superfamily enzyme